MTRSCDHAFLRSFVVSLIALLVCAGQLYGDGNERQVTKIADGVYAIQHAKRNTSGNTTVIIGDREVFVVDSGYFPSVAREDISQIRRSRTWRRWEKHPSHCRGGQILYFAFRWW